MREKTRVFLSWAFLGVFFGSMLALAVSGINVGVVIVNTVVSFHDRFGDPGIYFAVFLASIFGNFTVILPVPYILALGVVSVLLPVNVFFLALAAGLGAAIGESSAWLVGKSMNVSLHIAEHEKFARLHYLVKNGHGPLLLLLFAATPLPDDVLLIVLGVAGYSLGRALFYCFLGKVLMCFSVAFAFRAADSFFGKAVLWFYQDPMVAFAAIVVTVLFLLLFFAADWTWVMEKAGLLEAKIERVESRVKKRFSKKSGAGIVSKRRAKHRPDKALKKKLSLEKRLGVRRRGSGE